MTDKGNKSLKEIKSWAKVGEKDNSFIQQVFPIYWIGSEMGQT